MFNKKYKKALKILDEEIEFYYLAFRDSITLEGIAEGENYGGYMSKKAGEDRIKLRTLYRLRERLVKNLGDL